MSLIRWTSLILAVISSNGFSVSGRYVEGQVLVKFAPKTDPGTIQTILGDGYKVARVLVPELGLYLVQLPDGISVKTAMSSVRKRSPVIYMQPDHTVTLRETTPNDAEFSKQWGAQNIANPGADISAPLAWDLGQGGKDRDGNELVVAIVDGGMDLRHRDLVDNLWVNAGEIPGNGIDDDSNGYIDDVNGWNAYSSNGKVPSSSHGTHVAGIVGASGGNGLQVSGVNWKVKLMPVAASSGTTSVIAAGYGYVLAQKNLWLSSKGKKGANIVATNSSFGVDFADCKSGDYPVWNDLYENMGKAGILSAAATANQNIDVDAKGDVPTGCPSEFIVKVTNTTNKDMRNSGAAYGKKSIELGAPGTAILSTLPGDSTGNLTGTSMATPHVAGAIAFLHSVGSVDFQKIVISDPMKAAKTLKALMLGNVDPVASLKGITVTEGRLNLAKAAKAISNYTD